MLNSYILTFDSSYQLPVTIRTQARTQCQAATVHTSKSSDSTIFKGGSLFKGGNLCKGGNLFKGGTCSRRRRRPI